MAPTAAVRATQPAWLLEGKAVNLVGGSYSPKGMRGWARLKGVRGGEGGEAEALTSACASLV